MTIQISKLNSSLSPIITYTIDNIDMVAIDYDMPTSLLALPNSTDANAVAIKVDGNTSITTISWIIRNLDSNVVTGSDPSVTGANVKTVMQQLNFFDTHFQNAQTNDIFQFLITDANTPFYKIGNLIRMRFTVTSSTPVTIQADATIQTGNVITVYNADVPQPVTGVIATPTGTGHVALSWTLPSDHGSQPITNHIIQYYTVGTQYVQIFTGSATNSYTISGLTVGQAYSFQVASITSKGTGAWSASSSWATVT